MQFYPLKNQQDLYHGYLHAFVVKDISVLLIQQMGEIFVVENRCPHRDAPLDYASISNGNIRCPLHKMEFALSHGHGIGPAICTGGLEVFEVKVVDGVVGLEL